MLRVSADHLDAVAGCCHVIVTAPDVRELTCDDRAIRRKVSLVARYAWASVSDIPNALWRRPNLRTLRARRAISVCAITASTARSSYGAKQNRDGYQSLQDRLSSGKTLATQSDLESASAVEAPVPGLKLPQQPLAASFHPSVVVEVPDEDISHRCGPDRSSAEHCSEQAVGSKHRPALPGWRPLHTRGRESASRARRSRQQCQRRRHQHD